MLGVRHEDAARLRALVAGDDPSPLQHVDQPARAGVADSQAPLQQRNRCRLGLDDDLDRLVQQRILVRDALQQALESVGYRVIAPPSPAEAVVEAESNDVDLVITDVTMPGMNGHQVTERLETSKPELPVLLISGYDAQPQENHAGRAVLRSRSPLAELTNAVRELLDAA